MSRNVNNYCTNCGKTNHIYRECTYPIISYGIIIFKFDIHIFAIHYLH